MGLPLVVVDTKDQAQGNEVDQLEGPPIGEEGQGDSRNGHKPHIHSHIFPNMDEKHGRIANG